MFDTPRWFTNQVQAALWAYIVSAEHWGAGVEDELGKVPKVFCSRIRKLLNVDRATSPRGPWAFYERKGTSTGGQELYSDFQVFCLGLGLDLLNQGLTQAEVVFLLRHIRT